MESKYWFVVEVNFEVYEKSGIKYACGNNQN
jgi:hypothetical protein